MDISTEVVESNMIGLKFGGVLQRATMERVHAILAGGMLTKWEKLYSFDVDKESSFEIQDATPAKLSGNILVIFIVFCTGVITVCNYDLCVPKCKKFRPPE